MSFSLISIVCSLSFFHFTRSINDINIIVIYYYINAFIKMRLTRCFLIPRVNQ